MDYVGWVLLGGSRIARRHMVQAIREAPAAMRSNLPALPEQRIIGIQSRGGRAVQVAQEHAIPHAADDPQALLERPDVQCVYISNHPRHHAESITAALVAGKHVLCEPPLGLTVADAEDVVQMAADFGLMLAVNYASRAQPALVQMRALIENDAIGDLLGGRVANTRFLPVHQQTWRLEANGGGVLFDRTLHDIDILHYLFQDMVTGVDALSTQHLLNLTPHPSIHEEIFANLRFRRQTLTVSLHDSFFLPHCPPIVELYGTHGTLTAWDWTDPTGGGALQLRRRSMVTELPVVGAPPYSVIVAHFAQAILRQQPPLAGAAHALRAHYVVAGLDDAIRRGRSAGIQYTSHTLSDGLRTDL